jgi:hypothetical protein
LATLPLMILHPSEDGLIAIAQSAHALLAFQIAEHWGNRFTPRPSPRAEVLAAVLLHDAGWDGREEPLRLADDGRPLAFDTVPSGERETLWDSAVERAAVRGRYVAYLVSHHVSTLAGFGAEGAHQGFLARQEALRTRLREELSSDPRYAEALTAGPDEVNRSVLRLADAIAVSLATGHEGTVRFPDLPRRGGSAPLALSKVAERTYRLRPWPLVGRQLTVTTEGRLLPAQRFRNEASLAAAWREALTVRLSWTLLATGAPSD